MSRAPLPPTDYAPEPPDALDGATVLAAWRILGAGDVAKRIRLSPTEAHNRQTAGPGSDDLSRPILTSFGSSAVSGAGPAEIAPCGPGRSA